MSESTPFLPTHATLMPLPEASDALAVGASVGEFEIKEVIGVGGFGIVYRAWEPALQREVALKEYMPMGMVARAPEGRVTLRSRAQEPDFSLGLRSFVNEARLLARFDHPALVKVHRFWEANGTAYMAMPFYKAQTLRQRRQDMGTQPPTQDWLLSMIEPLLGALGEMHRADVYHRDIAPDNILWCTDNRPVLLDFGAARQVLADRTQSLTAILKPQFAPIEQYADARSLRQGPWTDIFALASTCYFMLTGRPPLPATARILSDELAPLAELAPAGFSTQVLATLDWAMAVRPEDRPQSVSVLWEALHGHVRVPPAPRPAPREPRGPAGGRYEHTIQTGLHASGTADDTELAEFSMLHPAMGEAARSALDVAPAAAPRLPGALRRPPAILAAAAIAVGALAWWAPWQSSNGPGLAEAAAASAAPAVIAPGASGPTAAPSSVAAVPSASDRELQAQLAWAAAHEASAPQAPGDGREATLAAVAALAASPREACHAGGVKDVAACVRRLCASEARFKGDAACAPARAARPPVHEHHWWLFGKTG